jgi:hypothetical protein
MPSSQKFKSSEYIRKCTKEIIAKEIPMYIDNDPCSVVKQKVGFLCFQYFKPMVLFLFT